MKRKLALAAGGSKVRNFATEIADGRVVVMGEGAWNFIKLDIENAEANALRGEPGSRVLPEILHFYAR